MAGPANAFSDLLCIAVRYCPCLFHHKIIPAAFSDIPRMFSGHAYGQKRKQRLSRCVVHNVSIFPVSVLMTDIPLMTFKRSPPAT